MSSSPPVTDSKLERLQKLDQLAHIEENLENEVVKLQTQLKHNNDKIAEQGSPAVPTLSLNWFTTTDENVLLNLGLVLLVLAVIGARKFFRFLCRPLQPAVRPLGNSPSDMEVPMAKVIEDAAFVLPKQAMLLNFVHHNPWENLQHMNFHDSFHYMDDLLKYMSPGERLCKITNGDPRLRANQALCELSGAFLDRGTAKWKPPNRDKGFLHFFASLEGCGSSDWREHARQMASHILETTPKESKSISESIIRDNLIAFGVPSDQWTNTIRVMLFELPGFAGMFQRMEVHPREAPHGATASVCEFAAVQSILARSSIEFLAVQSGWDPATPLGEFLKQAPLVRDHETELWQNPSGLAFKNQNLAKREALEVEYEETTLKALATQKTSTTYEQQSMVSKEHGRPGLQVYTCIDEREESFRRHLEEAGASMTGNPHHCETYGVAGFFNFPILFKGALADGRENEILAPEGSKPDCIVEETRTTNKLRLLLGRLEVLWEKMSFHPIFSLVLAVLSPFTFVGLSFTCLFPITKRVLSEQFWDKVVGQPKTDFKVPFAAEEAAMRLSQVLGNMGLKDRFAPIVVILGHGSRTVNNPFDAAHNCGACGGREGGPNARCIARCANDRAVREILARKYGIVIPDDTHFVGGYHDTSSELVEFADMEAVPASQLVNFEMAKDIIYKGQGRNALERCSKFMLAHNIHTEAQALTYVATRCTDLGEARPELGHATNASVVVGRRELTQGLFLARRAFLPTYDPFNDDERGTNLERVITPALIVCSGISLEYLFSTTDGGAGTKVCMNLVGHFGVQQGTAGDLLVGLPTQMTEMHSPVRALYLVDAPVSRVKAVLSRNETIRNIVHNDWIRLFVRDPTTKQFYRQADGGEYIPVEYFPGTGKIETDVPFTEHASYVTSVRRHESLFFWLSTLTMLLSCGMSTHILGPQAMHVRGVPIAVGGTMLALCALTFSRRYLQGEFMFDRMALLSAGLVVGFNMIATAPSLGVMLVGWNLLGFCSAFLIGSYNERPTVRQNTTYVFAVYRVSDTAMLIAGAFNSATLGALLPGQDDFHQALVAAGILVAALLKTSQFPVTNLFSRSMEGTSPGSALGDAALAAHVGIVLLSGTMPLWFGFTWARITLASVGLITAITSSLIAKVRPDRKGSIGYATQATLGVLYTILALGYVDTTLILAFGHAAVRMVQMLRSANFLLEYHTLTGILEHETEPTAVSEWWYKLCWRLNRWNSDTHLPQVLHMFKQVSLDKPLQLGKTTQWFVTSVLIILAGAPFSPLLVIEDHFLSHMLFTNQAAAAILMAFSVVLSTCIMWFIMANVLDPRRFIHAGVVPPSHKKVIHEGSEDSLLKNDHLLQATENQRKLGTNSEQNDDQVHSPLVGA
jgi:uncharacterized protein YbcC (UPF0753/DUF2309 family)